jgi:hypothetical protein
MADQEGALKFLRHHLQELEAIQKHVAETLNAILAKEQFQKWKRKTLEKLGEHVGPGYAKTLSSDWLEGTFAGADMYEEIEDDIDMCVRQLKKLAKEIEAKGLDAEMSGDSSLT